MHRVVLDPARNGLAIEYDPEILTPPKLVDLMCCAGVYPVPDRASAQKPAVASLRDGRRVTIRCIRRDDVARNAAFLDRLSPRSKHLLFLGGIARLSDAALRRLCDPDYAHDMAFVAVIADPASADGERLVGVCRYAGAERPEGAEISVAVADDWQGQGLGRTLLRQLVDHARAQGVRRLYSMDAASNQAMRRLARDVGFTEQPDPDDVHQVIYSLRPAGS